MSTRWSYATSSTAAKCPTPSSPIDGETRRYLSTTIRTEDESVFVHRLASHGTALATDPLDFTSSFNIVSKKQLVKRAPSKITGTAMEYVGPAAEYVNEASAGNAWSNSLFVVKLNCGSATACPWVLDVDRGGNIETASMSDIRATDFDRSAGVVDGQNWVHRESVHLQVRLHARPLKRQRPGWLEECKMLDDDQGSYISADTLRAFVEEEKQKQYEPVLRRPERQDAWRTAANTDSEDDVAERKREAWKMEALLYQ
ncbi:hypothetical protein Slin15195_G081610 [Septoria linicola]|uniref:Uncharacterized protein n=1 Tax=Septoria linicola TaxID=215465 RepID=A0A9Q9ELV5_9PEZI|nr:hypothetical protein Slin15195_G081610 [Septoria linicola]